MAKQVAIHLSRAITLNRNGEEPVVMTAGRNVVDAAVAEHPFVKHHMLDEATVASVEDVAALNARIAELEQQLANAGGKGAKARIGELEKEVESVTAAARKAADEGNALIADLQAQLAQKDADMTALVASVGAKQ